MNPSIALKTLKLLRNPMEIENTTEKEEIKLTNREVEVLEHLSKGLSYNLIADNLILSVGTVRKHIENIYKKLQVPCFSINVSKWHNKTVCFFMPENP